MEVIFSNLISEKVLDLILPFALLIIGAVVETKYVGRVALFSNALALFIFYHSIIMPFLLGLIVNSVIIIGIIGGFARIANISLFGGFYKFAWIGSSAFTGLLLLYGLSL